jgi:hypothetical protein
VILLVTISENYNDEVEVDVAPLDVCGVVFGSLYMYMKYTIFIRKENKYYIVVVMEQQPIPH